jgi:hypothetical protein
MKKLNFYSFDNFNVKIDDKINFNGYGVVLNLLFLKESFKLYFNELNKFSELRLFFYDTLENPNVSKELSDKGYYLSPALIENPHYNIGAIVPFCVSCGDILWADLTEVERKKFLIYKWCLFFENLPKHYLVVPSEKINLKTLSLIKDNWEIEMPAFNKSIKYKKEEISFEFLINTSEVLLFIITSKFRKIIMKYNTSDFYFKCGYRKISIKNDILIIEPKNIFEAQMQFDLNIILV